MCISAEYSVGFDFYSNIYLLFMPIASTWTVLTKKTESSTVNCINKKKSPGAISNPNSLTAYVYEIPFKATESNSLAYLNSHWCLVTSLELDPMDPDTMNKKHTHSMSVSFDSPKNASSCAACALSLLNSPLGFCCIFSLFIYWKHFPLVPLLIFELCLSLAVKKKRIRDKFRCARASVVCARCACSLSTFFSISMFI